MQPSNICTLPTSVHPSVILLSLSQEEREENISRTIRSILAHLPVHPHGLAIFVDITIVFYIC
jgi:hypothetical protein